MTNTTRQCLVLGLVFLGASVARPARAQVNPHVEVSAAFAPLLDSTASLAGLTARPMMSGWNLEVAGSMTTRLSVVFAADGAAGRQPGESAYGVDNMWRDRSLLGGVRATYRSTGSLAPYWQILAGTFKSDLTYTSSYASSRGSRFTHGDTDIVVQPGAGLNLMLNQHIGIRLGADVKILPNFDWSDSAAGASMFRVAVGAVVPLGRRR